MQPRIVGKVLAMERMFGVQPMRMRRRRPDILADYQGRRESTGQYSALNKMPRIVPMMSQLKSSMLNDSQSTDPANE
jgi:hypothetical protein